MTIRGSRLALSVVVTLPALVAMSSADVTESSPTQNKATSVEIVSAPPGALLGMVAISSVDAAKHCPMEDHGTSAVEIVSAPPGATIYIGDAGCASVGTTPWTGKLPKGDHRVRLEAPG